MNCLLQKSLRDRVLTDRCNMDSILWFHLECPKDVAKFDDPVEFKRKFRNFFAETRTAAENATFMSDETKRIRDEYSHVAYPEDVRERKEYRLFQDTFKQYSPILRPQTEDEDEELAEWEDIEPKDTEIGVVPKFLAPRPISRDEAKRSD